ncbi:unnamed protein product [Kluyveromyces dobzhanskii CBS 2104]|uniref:WGS project CCBQ000000000 data, contig 00102 n=1 Tax=Kluyveromyces dobzhanskii CBS 2104 TaxID=1427455 RepID=A0A0A8L681_9SACH|nr:unnamed protein product [Kluyveromyces dobzhanskii CBS 2104]
MMFFVAFGSTLTDRDLRDMDILTSNVDQSHFAAMFPAELIRTSLNSNFDCQMVHNIINESAEQHGEFVAVGKLSIPSFICEPLYDRMTYLSAKLQSNLVVDMKHEISILNTIVNISSNVDEIKLDIIALFKIKRELEVDIADVSKFKLLKTCLLVNLFPFMQGECEGLLREKLIEQLKVWIEVWKSYHSD